MSDLISIASPVLAATISPLGAELQTLTANGQELLWDGDPSWWTGRAPLLFPIVGALAHDTHTDRGVSYSLPKHGFARKSRFTLFGADASSATFRLEASEATLAAYPWRFHLDVTFAIADLTLITVATVTNVDERPMPASFGFHPAFRWPLPGAGERAAQVVMFSGEEEAPASRIDHAGLLVGPEPINRIVARHLALTDDLFDDDALLFLSPASRHVHFGARDGSGTGLDIAFPDLPHLGIWTKPGGAPYLCIEPWQGYASPVGFTGALADKPGILLLEPGTARSFEMSVTVTGA